MPYDVRIEIQGRAFTGKHHDRCIMQMCGDVVTPAYFQLLDLPLSRWLQLWETWLELKQDIIAEEKRQIEKSRRKRQ